MRDRGRWGTNKRAWRFRIKPVSGSIYLEEAGRNNDEIMQIDSENDEIVQIDSG